MVLTAGAFTTFLSVGLKETLTDLLVTISPRETPFFSSIGKITEGLNSRLVEWQVDALSAGTINSVLEGDAVTLSTAVATTRHTNRCQISNKVYGISHSLRNANAAGRGDELAYQRMKAGLELRTDVEVVLLTNQARTLGTGSAVNLSAGLPTWITNISTTSGVAATGNGSDTASVTVTTAITYEQFASANQLAYVDGGKPSIFMMTPSNKRAFSLLSFGAAPSTADIRYNINRPTPATAVGTVEKVLGDFGELDIVPNRQMARQAAAFLRQSCFLIDPERVKVAMYEPFSDFTLGKTGATDRGFIEVEYTLVVTAPDAHAAIFGTA